MFRWTIALLATVIFVAIPAFHSPSPAEALGDQWDIVDVPIPGLTGGDEAGSSVALSGAGDTVAIGEPQSQVSKPGRVRVFTNTTGSWVQVGASLVGAVNGDFFGNAVALSDDGLTLAVGAPGFDITGTSGAGRVSVYRYDGSSWSQRGDPIVGTATTKTLGSSLALSADGNRVAIGSQRGGTGDEGVVQVFDFSTSWTLVGAAIPGGTASALSGTSVALSSDGSRLAIGAIGATSNAGAVSVLALTAGTWTALGSPIAGAVAGDNLGQSIDLNGAGDVLVMGAPGHDTGGANAGQVIVRAYNGTSWIQRGADIAGVAAGDQFGWAVALNSSGDRLSAGAPYADTPGASAGEVRNFALSAGEWGLLGQTITGDVAGDQAGYAVATSSTGLRVAIGAQKKSTWTGQVRVFSYPEPLAAGSAAARGVHGIHLHLAGAPGAAVEGSPVYFGSYGVAGFSPYALSLESHSGGQARVPLSVGATDARGMLEGSLKLGALAPGTYTLAFTGRHAGGTGLRLATVFTVSGEGRYLHLGGNTHGIW
jgi:hypothetical protein